jgi:hypothetical protein
MEGDYASAKELRDAGASGAFVAYYKAGERLDTRTSQMKKAERITEGSAFASGGGFFDSIWNDDPRFQAGDNPYGADKQNGRLLEEAGLYE